MTADRISKLILDLNTTGDTKAEKPIAKLVAIGPNAVAPLLKAAKDLNRSHIRKWSFQALGSIGDKRAAIAQVKAFDDPRMTVKLHSLKGLGE